jgi:hypothetical protein
MREEAALILDIAASSGELWCAWNYERIGEWLGASHGARALANETFFRCLDHVQEANHADAEAAQRIREGWLPEGWQ